MLIFFHILGLQECWVLMESRIPLKLVLGYVKIVALSISSHEQTQKNKSAVFLYCRFSLFLKDLFFPDNLEVATAVIVPHVVGKSSPPTLI